LLSSYSQQYKFSHFVHYENGTNNGIAYTNKAAKTALNWNVQNDIGIKITCLATEYNTWCMSSTQVTAGGHPCQMDPPVDLTRGQNNLTPARRHGMTSRKIWHQQNHWSHFVASSTHICSGSLYLTTCWISTDCLRWTLAVVPILRPPKNLLIHWLIDPQ